MRKKLVIIILIFFSFNILFAKSDGLKKAIVLFNENRLEEAKFKF